MPNIRCDRVDTVGSEAATGGVLSEKMFLEISQNSQENTWFGHRLKTEPGGKQNQTSNLFW